MKDYSFRGVPVEKEKADNFCWGFTEPKSDPKRLYFKMPPLMDNEVRIKILYSGLCHTDYHREMEAWKPVKTFPFVPGHEIIGEIEKTGTKTKLFSKGDIVAVGPFRDCCGLCEYCLHGEDQLCTEAPYKQIFDPYIGGFSTHLHIREDFVFPLPKELDPSKSAPILCAGLTVFAPLKKYVIPGARCGIVGIGGLGHMAIQMANKMGMHVVAISKTPDKETETKALGAKEFFVSSNEDHMKRLMKKEKCDIILNTAYIHDLTQFVMAVKPGGCFINCALTESNEPVVYDMTDLVEHQKTFVGTLAGSRNDVKHTLDFCAKHQILPQAENFEWKDFPKAYAKLADVKTRFRCIIDVAKTFDNQ